MRLYLYVDDAETGDNSSLFVAGLSHNPRWVDQDIFVRLHLEQSPVYDQGLLHISARMSEPSRQVHTVPEIVEAYEKGNIPMEKPSNEMLAVTSEGETGQAEPIKIEPKVGFL